MKNNILFLSLLFASLYNQAQIKGIVSNTKGNTLPFVSVYIENSNQGTTTNNNGFYTLDIKKQGNYTVIFQFLGFKTLKKKLTVTNLPFILDVSLEEEQVTLDEVQLISKENIANKIILKTVQNREKNTAKFTRYTADFYSRGLFRIEKAPEKFLGKNLGDFGGGLDSTRSGVIYLSETISKITQQQNPKKFKEHIIASKVSGQDNGISFNRAEEVNFNIYNNNFKIDETQIISPIGKNSFQYYTYKLTGTFYDSSGKLINKINIIPKRENDPVLRGHIYIVEDQWSVYGIDVNVLGKQIGIPILNELNIKQNYHYKKEQSTWIISDQILEFKASILNFKFNGKFYASYTNYRFPKNFTEKTFSNEILSFDKNATKKNAAFWLKHRPISLTSEEIKDYQLKDSVKTIRSSKQYLDSIDRKNNKPSLLGIFTQYKYNNSFKKWSLDISGPLKNFEFNSVQGINSSLGLDFNKKINKTGKEVTTGVAVNYGFDEKKARVIGYFGYQWNNISHPSFKISGGVTVQQFNANNPISPFWNTLSTTLFKKNYMKIYEKKFVKTSFSQEITNGLRLQTELEYANRNPLLNSTRFNEKLSSNNPLRPDDYTKSFTSHNMWTFSIGTTVSFGQKHLTYPDRKINLKSKRYPTLFLGYRKTFGSENTEWGADLFHASLKQKTTLGNLGIFNYHAKGGLFLQEKDIPFMDYMHFNGNRIFIAPDRSYTNVFLALPYYQFSTNDRFAEFHGEHNFKGAILNKIPLLNKLNLHLVTGVKGLFTANNKPYSEFTVGLDNLGFGKWRFLRVDWVQSYFNGQKENRIVLGIKL